MECTENKTQCYYSLCFAPKFKLSVSKRCTRIRNIAYKILILTNTHFFSLSRTSAICTAQRIYLTKSCRSNRNFPWNVLNVKFTLDAYWIGDEMKFASEVSVWRRKFGIKLCKAQIKQIESLSAKVKLNIQWNQWEKGEIMALDMP